MEAKHVNEFKPNEMMWEKTLKGLLRNPDRLLINTGKSMIYIYGNMFFAKKDFTFGLRTMKCGEIHFIQMMHVPMLIYEMPASSLKCQAQPNVIRSFVPYNQMLYHRTILEPHKVYPIPAGTNYIVLTLLPPTPVHVPTEKRLLEEKSLHFSKRRISPVMRSVSRRQIPDVPELVQIPHVLEPVQIPHAPEPVQIPPEPLV
ncbi:hypothetical protein TNCV_1936651 [Trichonephila clavipes]|nr:hypothetical protein TNCV_1936651 [Trichonephila clavipes]